MLMLEIKSREIFDEEKQHFYETPSYTLKLEHSLLSISKWESLWRIPFLEQREGMTLEQTKDYIRCMTINDVPKEAYDYLTNDDISEVNKYIEDPHTATWFTNNRRQPNNVVGKDGRMNNQIVTNELVYFMMNELGIDKSCEKWHFNRLMTLIKVTNIERDKSNPKSKNKMSKEDLYAMRREQNAKMRAKMHSKG